MIDIPLERLFSIFFISIIELFDIIYDNKQFKYLNRIFQSSFISIKKKYL